MRLHPIALTVMTLMLAACGGGGGSNSGGGSTSTPKTITITPALGLTEKAAVTVYRLNGEAIVSSPLYTDSTGKVTVTLPADVDAIMVKVQGGADATYFEEAKGARVSFPAGFSLRAMSLVGDDGQQIAVTPLTNAAVRLAEGSLGGINKVSLIQANDAIAAFFDVDQVTALPHLIGKLQDFTTLTIENQTGRAATKYAILLAALSQYAASSNAGSAYPSLALTTELGDDLADGILDNATAAHYKAGNFPNGLKMALDALKSGALNGTPLPTNPENSSLDINAYYNNFIFKINGSINAADYAVDTGPGIPTTSFLKEGDRIRTNIAAADLSAYNGLSRSGTSLTGKPCTISINGGTVTIAESGSAVAVETFNGGDEDILRQTIDNKVVTSRFYSARASTDATKAVFVGFTGNNLNMAGAMDEITDKDTNSKVTVLQHACYITVTP